MVAAVEDVSTQQKGVCVIKYDLRNNHNYGQQSHSNTAAEQHQHQQKAATASSGSIFDSFHFRQQQRIIQQQQSSDGSTDRDVLPAATSVTSESTINANTETVSNYLANSNSDTSTDQPDSKSLPITTKDTIVDGSNDREYYNIMSAFHVNFPIKMVSFHVCYVDPSMIKRNWFAFCVQQFGIYDRAKFRFHHGTWCLL